MFANSGDPDQTPHSALFAITLLGVSKLQWVKILSGIQSTQKNQHVLVEKQGTIDCCRTH